MAPLKYDYPLPNLPGVRVDAISDDAVFEVIVGAKDVRRLRAAFMELAHVADGMPEYRLILVLDEPEITNFRLHDEWERAGRVIRPELFRRFSMYVRQADEWFGFPDPPTSADRATIEEVSTHIQMQPRPGFPSGSDAYYEILRVLLYRWMKGMGPAPVCSIMEASGASYPTVARAIERLGSCVRRGTDRSVELTAFPKEEWGRLVALSEQVRRTTRFTDRSGRPRSPESLARRLQKLHREDVGIGGVLGAKHYDPGLNLTGSPRLDLTLHSPGKVIDVGFVEKLDPALQITGRGDEHVALAVHILRRKMPAFDAGADGTVWTDPVECLLDLHEARLETQALEFLRSFPAVRGKL